MLSEDGSGPGYHFNVTEHIEELMLLNCDVGEDS